MNRHLSHLKRDMLPWITSCIAYYFSIFHVLCMNFSSAFYLCINNKKMFFFFIMLVEVVNKLVLFFPQITFANIFDTLLPNSLMLHSQLCYLHLDIYSLNVSTFMNGEIRFLIKVYAFAITLTAVDIAKQLRRFIYRIKRLKWRVKLGVQLIRRC